MTKEALEAALTQLELAASIGSVRGIDEAVAKVMQQNDSSCLSRLLGALNDHAPFDEGMFSIIHAAESFEDPIYVRGLFDALPDLVENAPKWASILLMRIFNDAESHRRFVAELSHRSREEKNAAEWLCKKINEVDPRFISKTVAVLAGARAI